MKENKNWIDYRVEEMEEKSMGGELPALPEYDMDGTRFQIDELPEEMDDAYNHSISWRMGMMMGIVHPEEWKEEKARRDRKRELREKIQNAEKVQKEIEQMDDFISWLERIQWATGYDLFDLVHMRITPLEDYIKGVSAQDFVKKYFPKEAR